MKNLTKKQVKEYVRIHSACQTFYIVFECEQDIGESDADNIQSEIQRITYKNLKCEDELILTTTDEILNYVRKHF